MGRDSATSASDERAVAQEQSLECQDDAEAAPDAAARDDLADDSGTASAPLGEADGTPFADEAAEITTESIVEAVLFSSDSPLPAARIAQILGVGDARSVKGSIAKLNDKYAQAGASFRIEEISGGFQMLTLPVYNNWVSRLHSVRRESRLSPAALETLAVVAYKQPVVRADVESVRGVAVGDVLNRLRELGLVKIVGRAEILGRPLQYGTTRKFLEVFGLASLDDLPKVEALALPSSLATSPAHAKGEGSSPPPSQQRAD